jgi:hypothetical protein
MVEPYQDRRQDLVSIWTGVVALRLRPRARRQPALSSRHLPHLALSFVFSPLLIFCFYCVGGEISARPPSTVLLKHSMEKGLPETTSPPPSAALLCPAVRTLGSGVEPCFTSPWGTSYLACSSAD